MQKVDVIIDYFKSVNYALIHNNTQVCQSFKLRNNTADILRDVQVECRGEYIRDSKSHVFESLGAGEVLRLTQLEIKPDAEKLMSLTERVNTSFSVRVTVGGECVFENSYELTLMAFDQWLGTSILPNNLVSFVTPNHPAISGVALKAAGILKTMTGSSGLSEYQTANINDVRSQVAAVYAALHGLGLVYRTAPASYETVGQRITLPSRVLSGKLGNCLELTLLFASVLENIGINSGIVIQKNHAYLGVWLVDDSCSYSICDDASFIEKKCSKGIDEMLVVECTHITNEETSFEDAVEAANRNLADYSVFDMFIDVRRCRLEGILPLPLRVDSGEEGDGDSRGVQHDTCVFDVKERNRYDLTKLREAKRELTKLDIWERRLLDFSLRNSLLNLHPGRKAVQFITFDIDTIEKHLSDGEDYNIAPKPDVEFRLEEDGKLVHSKLAGSLRELVKSDIEHHRFHTYLTDTDTSGVLKNIYRAARNAVEETGANSLFLAIGTLRWYETPRSDTPRYAPVLLLPVEMTYKKGYYSIRTRDEALTLNITLIEFLRQNYDITVNGLEPLPESGDGVDISLVFALLRDALEGQKRWDIEEECLLGMFSFNKFLMWNDIHDHHEELLQNDIIRSLVESRLTWTPASVDTDLKDIDNRVSPADVAIPVPVDSSQMSAVLSAAQGNTFILYGPPGTGKSQTITNLIANALYQNKRVLFVAEKMAALSVVQNRLAKIGLDPFCLEIHSNKVTKKYILGQLGKALDVGSVKQSDEFRDKADKIFRRRKDLLGYLGDLHNVGAADGLSLYDCIVGYETIDAAPLEGFGLSPELDSVLQAQGVKGVEDMLGGPLEAVLKLVGQPSAHGLNGLMLEEDYIQELYLEELRKAQDVLSANIRDYDFVSRVEGLKEEISRDYAAEVFGEDPQQLYDEWRAAKAKWIVPRIFAKRSYVKRLRLYNKYAKADEVDALLDNLADYKKAHSRAEAVRGVMARWFGADLAEDTMPDKAVLQDAESSVKRWIANKDKMRDWYHWCSYIRTLEECGLGCVAKAVSARAYTVAELHDAFLKALYKGKAEEKIAHSTLLPNFEGMIFDEKVKSYRRLTEEFQLLTQKELYARLAGRVRSVVNSRSVAREVSLLTHSISSGGRGRPLRDLLDRISTLLPRLCPCMLMSPMSVAQFLNLSQDKFDLVIFDEASQMPTSDAVGAIMRGKALVVVGDPKQMPPTSFFMSTSVGDDEVAIDDMESILEDCRALGMPSIQLNWHYRSRHESLIAFSNNEYYDGSLITFPSVDDQQVKVKHVHVDGYYDKGGKRCNRSEAEAIVREMVRRLKDEELRKYSIGVIAFSIVQQSLIEDIFQDCMDHDISLREAADQMSEPIFIKNLENVQGDERDVILFSIGYGPNQEGVVSMNFGPLNNSGGERRLNVAVSRARCEMMVFSTLRSAQIDLRRSKSKGVEGLKHFLEYAETQTLVNASSSNLHQEDATIARQIAKAIRRHGYEVKINVGRSKFRVDIAVSEPGNPGIYVLGILLDGKKYRDTQTTRDREIVQPSVLAGLHWKVMRVWSVDWFNNPRRVISRILEKLSSPL